jgi:hypothetical protein
VQSPSTAIIFFLKPLSSAFNLSNSCKNSELSVCVSVQILLWCFRKWLAWWGNYYLLINTNFFMFCWAESLYNLVNKANLVYNFFSMFISSLYMFRAIICPPSREITVSMRHLVFVTLCGWLFSMQGGIKVVSFRTAYETVIYTEWQIHRCRIDTVISPDDGRSTNEDKKY